jgi:hypothetical protein
VAVWRADTGEALARLVVAPRQGPADIGAADHWVEVLTWSADGTQLAASAGSHLLIASIGDERHATEASADAAPRAVRREAGCSFIYALTFVPTTPRCSPWPMIDQVACAAYGGVTLVPCTPSTGAPNSQSNSEAGRVAGSTTQQLPIGAAAVLSLAVSPDGEQLAAGCLDMRLRLFSLGAVSVDKHSAQVPRSPSDGSGDGGGALDWVGFDGPVRRLAWSSKGHWLAALGGSALLVITPSMHRTGVPPTMCIADAAGHARCTVRDAPPPIESSRFCAMAWCPNTRYEALLAALEVRTGCTQLFDVRVSDYAVPRRCAPIATVASLDGASLRAEDMLAGSTVASLAFARVGAAMATDDEQAGTAGSTDVDAETLVVSSGEWLAGIRVGALTTTCMRDATHCARA